MDKQVLVFLGLTASDMKLLNMYANIRTPLPASPAQTQGAFGERQVQVSISPTEVRTGLSTSIGARVLDRTKESVKTNARSSTHTAAIDKEKFEKEGTVITHWSRRKLISTGKRY